ncbi:MAG: hypothetical protein HY362_03535 [Candidatus Aenigmarchaeota archaeon]|nr:hypothetical protein [Candidatus Aenigmarchaeota archaeon]
MVSSGRKSIIYEGWAGARTVDTPFVVERQLGPDPRKYTIFPRYMLEAGVYTPENIYTHIRMPKEIKETVLTGQLIQDIRTGFESNNKNGLNMIGYIVCHYREGEIKMRVVALSPIHTGSPISTREHGRKLVALSRTNSDLRFEGMIPLHDFEIYEYGKALEMAAADVVRDADRLTELAAELTGIRDEYSRMYGYRYDEPHNLLVPARA